MRRGIVVFLAILLVVAGFNIKDNRDKLELIYFQAYSTLEGGWKSYDVDPYYTSAANWDQELKKDLSLAYPLSEEGLELLSSTKYARIPINHYVHGYAKSFDQEIKVTVSSPSLSFHEFSHVAFAKLVVGERKNYKEKIKKLQEAIVVSFTDPRYRGIFTFCTRAEAIRSAESDPEHALLGILEWSGGNLALVPEPLKEFVPWIKEGEIKSWDYLKALYMRSDPYTRRVMELRYGESNPLWQCLWRNLPSGSEITPKRTVYPGYAISESDRIFLDAEAREIRWFFDALKQGAFALWQEHFPKEIEQRTARFLEAAEKRHPKLFGEIARELVESLSINLRFSKLIQETSFNKEEAQAGKSFQSNKGGGSFVQPLTFQWFIEDVLYHLTPTLEEEPWKQFKESALRVPLPRQIVELWMFSEEYSMYVRKYCLFWENQTARPTAITAIYTYFGAGERQKDAIQIEYGTPNSCTPLFGE